MMNWKGFGGSSCDLLYTFISNYIYTLVKLTPQTRFGPNWAIFSDIAY
jgi:hypothetical protein